MNRRTAILVLMGSTIGYVGLTAPEAIAAVINLGEIMPLGDSITYGGGGTNAGYRGPLYNLLTSEGAALQFVGDSTLNPGSLPADQTQHSGHSSYTTYDITNNLDGVDYTRYDAFGGVDRDPNGGYWLTGGHGTGRDAIRQTSSSCWSASTICTMARTAMPRPICAACLASLPRLSQVPTS